MYCMRVDDFVGTDMARKFLQMGFSPKDKRLIEEGTVDPLKAVSACIFYKAWWKAEAKPAYDRMKAVLGD
jgi:hypothetical protein